MRLQRIQIANFRCFENLDLELKGRSLLLIGENAGGKTSLLCAIARAMGRDLSFSRADFRDPAQPIEITATLDEIEPAQRAILGDNVDFQQDAPAQLRVQARSVWDSIVEDTETEHLFPKRGSRSSRVQRESLPLLWLSAWRDVSRLLQFGSTRNIMGQLLADLPLDASIDAAIDAIRDASDALGHDAALQTLLDDARIELAGLLPDVRPGTYTLGVSAATGRDLLRQFDLIALHGASRFRSQTKAAGSRRSASSCLR